MEANSDALLLAVLTGAGVFALVGLIWNLTEGFFEEQRKDER